MIEGQDSEDYQFSASGLGFSEKIEQTEGGDEPEGPTMTDGQDQKTAEADSNAWRETVAHAVDAGSALAAFAEISRQPGVKRADLQAAIGEKMLQLGDIEKGMQFLVLSEQTKNVQIQANLLRSQSIILSRHEKNMDITYRRVGENMVKAADSMSRSSSRVTGNR